MSILGSASSKVSAAVAQLDPSSMTAGVHSKETNKHGCSNKPSLRKAGSGRTCDTDCSLPTHVPEQVDSPELNSVSGFCTCCETLGKLHNLSVVFFSFFLSFFLGPHRGLSKFPGCGSNWRYSCQLTPQPQ